MRAVIAESYERIHRSNLVGMGIIPFQYLPSETAESLGLTGREAITVDLPQNLQPGQTVTAQVWLTFIFDPEMTLTFDPG